MLAQLALALKDCHRRTDDSGASRPILHRDIKPANILLDSSQNVKAADFGLAKELSNHTKYAQTSVGTPLYMVSSPFFALGRTIELPFQYFINFAVMCRLQRLLMRRATMRRLISGE